MATSPNFAQTPKIGAASVSAANTARDGTGTIVTVFTAAATYGSRLNRVVLQATDNPADSVVTIFLHDGSSFWLFDEFDLGDPAAASTTAPGMRMERFYDVDIPGGWSLRAAITVALTGGVVNVLAFATDYTA